MENIDGDGDGIVLPGMMLSVDVDPPIVVLPLETVALPETPPPLSGEMIKQTVLAVGCVGNIDILTQVLSADALAVVFLSFTEVVVTDDIALADTVFNEDVLTDVVPLETVPLAEVPSLEMDPSVWVPFTETVVLVICSVVGLADEPLTAVEPLVADMLVEVEFMSEVTVESVPFTEIVEVEASAFAMLALEMENTNNEKTAITDNAKYILFIFIKNM